MSNLTPKIKADLMYLYELDEFKSFKKFLDMKSNKTALQLLSLDMSQPRSERVVAFLQGQAKALEWLQLELKTFYKREISKAAKQDTKA